MKRIYGTELVRRAVYSDGLVAMILTAGYGKRVGSEVAKCSNVMKCTIW
jgi:hypothetical protein